jgi:RNA polymerase primary sigma factor
MADQSRAIRVPVHAVELINKIGKVQRQMVQDLGRDPTHQEIAEELDMPVDKVTELIRANLIPSSLDARLGEDGDISFGDIIVDDNQADVEDVVAMKSRKEAIAQALNILTERERNVIMLRYGMVDGVEYTLDKVGERFGLTRERIRQIEHKAMTKLKGRPTKELLAGFSQSA